MNNFEGFGLSEKLQDSLAKMNYTAPTPIQAKAIPYAIQGNDILGSAQTGTGKTAAFSIPLVEALMRSEHGTAMVLTPTRELAKQVIEVIHQLLGQDSGINTAFIIGGDSMDKQMRQLKKNPRIIVGTPGRINDHLARKTMDLSQTGFLVLDETDRMLDMGFGVQLDKIFKFLPKERQTLMFSATLPKEIVKISERYLQHPKRVSVGETNVIAQNIKQEVVNVEQGAKYAELVNQLYERNGSVIVFVKTKYGADRMAKNLRRDGFTSDALHGDLRQNKRDKVMKNFREQNFRVLIATDIAARGLDVPHIEHVVNYDLPQVAEDYIHRMGRTARAGAKGSAVSFVSNQEGRKWNAIEMLLNPELAKLKKSAKPQRRNKNGSGKGGYKGKDGGFKGKGKPFKGKEGGFKGKGKPFKKREGGNDNRNDRGDNQEGEARKPFRNREDRDFKGGGKPAYKKRDDRQSEGRKSNESRGDKPFKKREDRNSKDGGKPSFKKRDDRQSEGRKSNESRGDKPFKKYDAKKSSGGNSGGNGYKGKRSEEGSKGGSNGKPAFKKRSNVKGSNKGPNKAPIRSHNKRKAQSKDAA